MEERNLVIILSDIHMGTNISTVWYQKEIHEKYLITALRYIIDIADYVEEVILLGDIFECWNYPPDMLPPSMDEMIKVNQEVLGIDGILRKALSVLKGRMAYIPGDHDMRISQADLNKIKSKDGFTIKYHYGAYVPIYDSSVLFMHGHECTKLNAPYFISKLAPLPIGYFVSRAFAYKINNILKKMPDKSIADLDEYGAYSYNDFLPYLSCFYENLYSDCDTVTCLIDALIEATGMSEDTKIRVDLFTTTTLKEVKTFYKNKGIIGQNIDVKDIMKEYNRMHVSNTIIEDCCQDTTDIVVMGHTHLPMIYQEEHQHVYTGYMCPSISRLKRNPVTFGIYQLSTKEFHHMKIVEEKTMRILPYYNKEKHKKFVPFFKKKSIKTEIKTEEAPIKPEKPFTFGWSVYNTANEFWRAMQAGVRSKAKELGINLLEHDEESNTVKMITGSLDLINQGVDALVIAPFNPNALPVIVQSAKKQNIPVISIDTGTGGAQVEAFIVSDNFGGGVLAGEYALNLIEKYDITSKNAVIIKVEPTSNAILRGEGFKGVMAESGYTIVAEPTGNSLEEEAYVEMKKILMTYQDDLAVVFSENGPMALGASRAIDEAGKRGEIMLIGFDASPSEIEAIKRKDMQGAIAQQPYRMGEIGVETAFTILLGEPVNFDNWQEKIILMEVFLVNEEGEFSQGII